jgi:hypothetical protein
MLCPDDFLESKVEVERNPFQEMIFAAGTTWIEGG